MNTKRSVKGATFERFLFVIFTEDKTGKPMVAFMELVRYLNCCGHSGFA